MPPRAYRLALGEHTLRRRGLAIRCRSWGNPAGFRHLADLGSSAPTRMYTESAPRDKGTASDSGRIWEDGRFLGALKGVRQTSPLGSAVFPSKLRGPPGTRAWCVLQGAEDRRQDARPAAPHKVASHEAGKAAGRSDVRRREPIPRRDASRRRGLRCVLCGLVSVSRYKVWWAAARWGWLQVDTRDLAGICAGESENPREHSP